MRTQRLPKEHFDAEKRPALLPAPTEPYDVPLWCEPKVARDQFAQVAKALYTLPTRPIGKTLRARADRATVRFYDGAGLVKVHARTTSGTARLTVHHSLMTSARCDARSSEIDEKDELGLPPVRVLLR